MSMLDSRDTLNSSICVIHIAGRMMNPRPIHRFWMKEFVLSLKTMTVGWGQRLRNRYFLPKEEEKVNKRRDWLGQEA
ncbi:hypothetical protein PROFUN_02608 [Planoprotostelium fungivorum]|uniref:Uncharacterized protein n=1 Tax=Planoprotostelium fungivorum TaxID=1890364 RepID=A0A2P6NV68_9EUKA|nr:hypothetical protein PROFUN_02608 [Planoprotostelium fungivorum]